MVAVAGVVALYAAAAVFPILGLALLLRSAARSSSEVAAVTPTNDDGSVDREKITIGQLDKAMRILVYEIVDRPRAVVRDFIFIGLGVSCGAAASIWSLFLK
jgi:hypothetical protein